MVWSGMCHSDEHLRTGDISADARGARDDGREVDVPGRRRARGLGHRHRGGDQRDPGGGGRPRRRVLHPVLRHVLLVCLGPPEPVRPRDDDAGRRHDQRRHLPLPPGRREPEPHGAARHLRRRDGRPRELARADQPLGQHEGGRARSAAGSPPASARRSTGARSSPARRWSWPAAGGVGSGAIQGARIAGARTIIAVDPVPFKLERGQGDRRDAHRGVAARRPDDAARSSPWAATPTWSS